MLIPYTSKAVEKQEDAAALVTVASAIDTHHFLRGNTRCYRGRHLVATCDIPGTFLQADQPKDDKAIIRSGGSTRVEALAQIDPAAMYRDKIVQFVKRL